MTTRTMALEQGYPDKGRVDFVDFAKGLCIIMVVMMHSTLGVEKATGSTSWMHDVILFAQPFRMPDFFLISGLFLARVIDRDWRTYLDRKVVHFLYFYVLWSLIQIGFKDLYPAIAGRDAAGFLEKLGMIVYSPAGSLWFIHMLPIFFVLAKLVRGVPPLLVLAVAAGLEMLHVQTGMTVIDEFCARLVYFLLGYYAATHVFRLAAFVEAHRGFALGGMAVWAVVNGLAVSYGLSQLPVISLALGIVGSCAVVTVAVFCSKLSMLGFLRYVGRNSIVIYLAFFIPMASLRTVLLATGILTDVATLSLVVSLFAFLVPLGLNRLFRDTVLRYVFVRPTWAHLAPAGRRPLVAAE